MTMSNHWNKFKYKMFMFLRQGHLQVVPLSLRFDASGPLGRMLYAQHRLRLFTSSMTPRSNSIGLVATLILVFACTSRAAVLASDYSYDSTGGSSG